MAHVHTTHTTGGVMPALLVEPARLAYEDRGARIPLLLVHGFGASSRQWEPQVVRFVRRHRVVTYDARGHGGSEAPAGADAYSEEIFVDDLRSLLDQLGLDRAYVGGLSMGANVALRFALAHPERTLGLILANAGAGSDDPAAWRRQWLVNTALLETRGLDAFLHAFAASPLAARYVAQGPEAMRRLRTLLADNGAEALAATARGVQATRPSVYTFEGDLRALDVPALVITGEHDAATLPPSRFLAGTLPAATLVVLAGVGHLSPLEAPERFNDAVEEFITRQHRPAHRRWA